MAPIALTALALAWLNGGTASSVLAWLDGVLTGWRAALSEARSASLMLAETRNTLTDLKRRIDALRGSL